MPGHLNLVGVSGPPEIVNTTGSAPTNFSDPDARAAAVTRDQWQNFLNFYKPIETAVINKAMQTDFTAEGDTAGATAAAGSRAAEGTLSRNLSRSGSSLTAEERRAVARRQESSLTKAIGRAENITRRGLRDSRQALLRNIVNIGTGVSRTALAGIQGVADLAAQREAAYQQGQTAAHNANVNMGVTAAATLIAMM